MRQANERLAESLRGVSVSSATAAEATIFAELGSGALKPDQAAELALGAQLRAYTFDLYKTKRKEGEDPPTKTKITIGVSNAGAAKSCCAKPAYASPSSRKAARGRSRSRCGLP